MRAPRGFSGVAPPRGARPPSRWFVMCHGGGVRRSRAGHCCRRCGGAVRGRAGIWLGRSRGASAQGCAGPAGRLAVPSHDPAWLRMAGMLEMRGGAATCRVCLPVAVVRYAPRKSGLHMRAAVSSQPLGGRRRGRPRGGPACLRRRSGARHVDNPPRPVPLPRSATAPATAPAGFAALTRSSRAAARRPLRLASGTSSQTAPRHGKAVTSAHLGLADSEPAQAFVSAGHARGQGRPECARASCGRLVRGPYCAAPALPARVWTYWHRRRLEAAGLRCYSAPCPAVYRRFGRLGGMLPDCNARQECDRLGRDAAAVPGCGLVAIAARIGGIAGGGGGEWV